MFLRCNSGKAHRGGCAKRHCAATRPRSCRAAQLRLVEVETGHPGPARAPEPGVLPATHHWTKTCQAMVRTMKAPRCRPCGRSSHARWTRRSRPDGCRRRGDGGLLRPNAGARAPSLPRLAGPRPRAQRRTIARLGRQGAIRGSEDGPQPDLKGHRAQAFAGGVQAARNIQRPLGDVSRRCGVPSADFPSPRRECFDGTPSFWRPTHPDRCPCRSHHAAPMLGSRQQGHQRHPCGGGCSDIRKAKGADVRCPGSA